MGKQGKSNTQKIPDWLPDWKKPEEYPDPGKTSLDQWAWEFLRRNDKYLQDCESIGVVSQSTNIVIPIRGDSSDEHSEGFIENVVQVIPVLNKYGLFHLCHPCTPFEAIPEWHFFNDFGAPLYDFFDEEKHNWRTQKNIDLIDDVQKMYFSCCCQPLIPKNQNEVVVKFDLNFPISDQINKVRDYLASYQKQLGMKDSRNQTDLYPVYLRLLDAETMGHTQREMAELIYPDELEHIKKVQRNLKAAREIRDSRPHLLSNRPKSPVK